MLAGNFWLWADFFSSSENQKILQNWLLQRRAWALFFFFFSKCNRFLESLARSLTTKFETGDSCIALCAEVATPEAARGVASTILLTTQAATPPTFHPTAFGVVGPSPHSRSTSHRYADCREDLLYLLLLYFIFSHYYIEGDRGRGIGEKMSVCESVCVSVTAISQNLLGRLQLNFASHHELCSSCALRKIVTSSFLMTSYQEKLGISRVPRNQE